MTTYLRTNQASLYLDTLLCTGRTTDSAGNVFTIRSMADAASWGAPQPIDVAVQRWMTDGAVASTQGYENREITFVVKISAASSVALAAGEAALVEAVRGAVTLAWVPPEGPNAAPTTVFDIWTGHLEHQLDPDAELRFTRAYQVTLTAKPWARSEAQVISTALPTGGTPTTVSVDTCTATTGWTGSPFTPTVFSATAVRESGSSGPNDGTSGVTRVLTRTGSVTGMGTTPYLALDARFSGYYLATMTVTVDGLTCTKVATSGTVTYWKVPTGVTSFTKLVITAVSKRFFTPTGITITLDVYDVTRTNTIVGVSTHKMLNQHLDVGGSVTTSGSIQLASPSATVLGNVLAYTCADTGSGYTPAMRQYRTSGGTLTTDATMVSGTKELVGQTFTTPVVVYTLPPGVLQEGTYVAVARVVGGPGGTPPENVTLRVRSTEANGTTVRDEVSTSITVTANNQVQWAVVGAIALPGVARPQESAASVVVQFQVDPTGSSQPELYLDELFLLDVTHGSFTLVTGISPLVTFTRLWVDSPDFDAAKNRPQVYYGTAADRSDAAGLPYAQIMSMGDHDLDSNGSMVFTVTDNVDDPVITATYYQRWHTHAAA